MEKIALLFPGQGAHFVGMGRNLYEQHEVARRTFEEANETLGFDLAKICFEGSVGELARADHAHPGLVTVSIALFRIYMQEFGILPHFCAGHSLGEYAALVSAGVIRFADALRIVHRRGQLAEAVSAADMGTMSVLEGLPPEVVQAECARVATAESPVAVSCYNTPRQVNISGIPEAVMAVEDRVGALGGRTTPLFGSAPFHSPLMEKAAQELKPELERCSYRNPRYPVLANVSGLPYQGAEQVVRNLLLHMVRPVQWQAIMAYLRRAGVTLVVEMGAKNLLCNLVQETYSDMQGLCMGVREDQAALRVAMGARRESPTLVTRCLAAGAATPNRNPDPAVYRDGVVKPYQRIQAIQTQLEREKLTPSVGEMHEALAQLRLLLQNKHFGAEEEQALVDQLIDETGTHHLFRSFAANG